MNRMLTDDDLTRLLGVAADSFPRSSRELVLETPARRRAVGSRRAWTMAAAAATVGVLVLVTSHGWGGSPAARTSAASTSDQVGGRLGPVHSAPLANGPKGAAGFGSDRAATPIGPSDGARIVLTGSMALVVEKGKVAATAQRVQDVAAAHQGFVSDAKSTETGDDPSSTLTLRVPVGSFPDVVKQVRAAAAGGVGTVETATSSGQDITAQYADIGAQIGSLTAVRDRFLTILSQAKTIAETLSVQQRVDDVQGQIDRLTGQRKVLAAQSDKATLTVTVSEKPKVAASHEPSGIAKAWDQAQHGFTSGIDALVAKSGRALLVLLVGLAGMVILRSGWRLARRRLV